MRRRHDIESVYVLVEDFDEVVRRRAHDRLDAGNPNLCRLQCLPLLIRIPMKNWGPGVSEERYSPLRTSTS